MHHVEAAGYTWVGQAEAFQKLGQHPDFSDYITLGKDKTVMQGPMTLQ
jgi:hypothetical protein